jgi:hypothetical protein
MLETWIPLQLGSLYDYLGLDSTDIDNIISNVLEFLDITDETSISSKILHIVANTMMYRYALNELSVSYQASVDGSSYNRQQVFEHVKELLANAESESSQYTMLSTVGEVIYTQNPYDLSTYFISI